MKEIYWDRFLKILMALVIKCLMFKVNELDMSVDGLLLFVLVELGWIKRYMRMIFIYLLVLLIRFFSKSIKVWDIYVWYIL